ncbi:multidrug transporter [Colletotrichum tropicale]|nr:multidrug transporter [Colletotrichum tropicale]
MAEPKDAKNESGTGPVPEPLRIPLGDAGVAEPYSIFTRKEKWFIVGMVAVAGFYSPLPANIYLPAIPKLSEAFGKSVELLNLTVTAFLAMQGICAGVIGDISTPEERGGFFGMFNLGPMISPCIAPAIGGALSDKLGWRSIFWFLIVMAVCCLLFILLFLPETLRNLVGNGSVTLGGVYTPLVPVVGRSRKKQKTTPAKPGVRPSINPFVILVYPDVAITLAFTGVVYAVNNTVVTTVASSFARVYPWLSETALGLCYLPTGFGMIVGSTLTGKFLDWDYARIKKRVEESDGAFEFPKEYARLRTMPVLLVLFSGAVIAWGFCVDKGVHIAVPLALQVVCELSGTLGLYLSR